MKKIFIIYGHYNDKSSDALDREYSRVKVNYAGNFGNIFVNSEFDYLFGDWSDFDDDAKDDVDVDAMAFWLQGGMDLGALTVSGEYFFAEGRDEDEDDKENYMGSKGTGEDFQPLYLLTGPWMGLLNGDNLDTNTPMQLSGVHGVVVAADFKASDKVALHAALGVAWSDEEADSIDQDDDYGWEINLGVKYQLLDNLNYNLNFGYLDTGDYFEMGDLDWDTEDVYAVTNSINLSF